ncbi:ABC-F family ATP-binding cassette domain-containing protein [bacterium]|nr:ABC-F family ATP-binding cassette domain-containing protein [bacterium]
MALSFGFNALNYTIAARKIIENASLSFGESKRYALVGPNGCGKSTLLKILAGKLTDHEGEIFGLGKLNIGYLPQEPFDDVDLEDSVWNIASHNLKQAASGWDLLEGELIANLLLMGFSSDDLDRPLAEFSGGFMMRAALAGIITGNPDILLLDEPENHLDIKILGSIAEKLKQSAKIILFVSHNPDLIDLLSTDIIDMDNRKFSQFACGFHEYMKRKEELIEKGEADAATREEKIKKLKEFIRKNIADKSTTKQARTRQKVLNKILENTSDVPIRHENSVKLAFLNVPKQPRVYLRAESLELSYGDDTIIKSGSFKIERDDKLGFLGANGSGKTTIVKAIANDPIVERNMSRIEVDPMTSIAYFSQDREMAEIKDMRLEDFVQRLFGPEYRMILARFLFFHDLDRKIGVLSGGEKARVGLMELVSKRANLLILDEPTHHLDIRTVGVFKDVLKSFPGAVLLISHHSDLFDGLVNKVLTIKNKVLHEYYGSYHYIRDKHLTDEISEDIGGKAVNLLNPKEKRKKRNDYRARLEKLRSSLEKLEEELFQLELLREEASSEELTKTNRKIKKAEQKFNNIYELKINIESKLRDLVSDS